LPRYRAIAASICPCTGYQQIIDAIVAAALYHRKKE
jgi:aerobic-type carbon monoxide dehydrogenase small subunit (CoxS/CutS family)